MCEIANSVDSDNENMERLNFEHNPIKFKFRLKDGRTVHIEELENNGKFGLVCKVVALEDGKPRRPSNIVWRCLVGRTKWKKVENPDVLPKDAVIIPL